MHRLTEFKLCEDYHSKTRSRSILNHSNSAEVTDFGTNRKRVTILTYILCRTVSKLSQTCFNVGHFVFWVPFVADFI